MTAKVLIFSCNWDGWSCIDSAANEGLGYPASVNIIKLTCLSSVNAGFIVKAFEHGVDGVMLLGCNNRKCQYGQFGDNVEIEYNKAKEIIGMLGFKGDRIMLVKMEPFDGTGFIERLNGFIHEIKSLAVPAGAQKGANKR
ncbi:MAG: hydrogenase iron-sulfur subunit [Dehalococcoidia bacterium]